MTPEKWVASAWEGGREQQPGLAVGLVWALALDPSWQSPSNPSSFLWW